MSTDVVDDDDNTADKTCDAQNKTFVKESSGKERTKSQGNLNNQLVINHTKSDETIFSLKILFFYHWVSTYSHCLNL